MNIEIVIVTAKAFGFSIICFAIGSIIYDRYKEQKISSHKKNNVN